MSARARRTRVRVCTRASCYVLLRSVQSQTEQRTKSPFMAINATTAKNYTNYSALIRNEGSRIGGWDH